MKTVLIIEDNPGIRENTCELLELEGYQVICAENGKSGLALALQNKPDIILCDIMMPVLNGYEVLKGVRNNAITSGIPFVFLSASVEKKEVDAALNMGAQGYIRKPYEPEELFTTIARLINKK